jgi:hypothetical protein
MWVNLQDRGFGLGQGALFGTHHGIPVVKPDAKIARALVKPRASRADNEIRKK